MNLAAGFLGIDWQNWVGILIGLISSIVIPVSFHQRQKKPRTLDYAIRSTQDLTSSASHHVQTRMEVIWSEPHADNEPCKIRPLKEPRIVNYHIRNTGKRAIDATDLQDPIKVKAAKGSIVDVVVIDVSHERMIELGSIPLGPDGTNVLKPALMNPKDWIEIQVITDGCPYPPKLTCWIREESRPMQQRQSLLYPPLREFLKRGQPGPQWYEVVIVIITLLWVIGLLLRS